MKLDVLFLYRLYFLGNIKISYSLHEHVLAMFPHMMTCITSPCVGPEIIVIFDLFIAHFYEGTVYKFTELIKHLNHGNLYASAPIDNIVTRT